MDKLKDRYFIRLRHQGEELPERLPLANRETLFRVFIHFLFGKINSLEVWNEKYFDRKVMAKPERINGKLIRKNGITLRQKTLEGGVSIGSAVYDQLANQFREGLYDPESKDGYTNETSNISRFTEEQFDDAMELLTLIHEGKY